MQTVYLKEHEGNVRNSIGQLSSVPAAPWWSQLGSQQVYGATCGQLKSFSMEEAGQRLDKGNPRHFTFFPGDKSPSFGDCKSSPDGQKDPGAFSLQSPQSENRACFEIGFGQHMICAKYPYADQYYGVLSTYGPQISGRIMLPLNLSSDDGPIYVNAKQYHGIIRRRKSRAKAVLENKMTSRRKPYMHYSRHLHAIRRPRGCGGRFLNTKNIKEENGKTEEKKGGEEQCLLPSGSQSSEVLQSEGGNLNSSKETHCNTSTLSGAEVTSMYSRGDFNHFPFSHLRPSFQSSGNTNNGHGIVMPNQWVAAADGCNNLKA